MSKNPKVQKLAVVAAPLQVVKTTDLQTLNGRYLTVEVWQRALAAVPAACAHWRVELSFDKFFTWLNLADNDSLEGEIELSLTTLVLTLNEQAEPRDCAVQVEFIPWAEGNPSHYLNRPQSPGYSNRELVAIIGRSYRASRDACIRRGARDAAAVWDAIDKHNEE